MFILAKSYTYTVIYIILQLASASKEHQKYIESKTLYHTREIILQEV
jgi:hypothetical protein